MLDLQVVLDELEFPAERRELALGLQHAAQQRGQLQQRVERAGRRGFNQVADGRQRVEQKVRVDLRAQGAQFGLGREAHDLLFAQPLVITLVPRRIASMRRAGSSSGLLQDAGRPTADGDRR